MQMPTSGWAQARRRHFILEHRFAPRLLRSIPGNSPVFRLRHHTTELCRGSLSLSEIANRFVTYVFRPENPDLFWERCRSARTAKKSHPEAPQQGNVFWIALTVRLSTPVDVIDVSWVMPPAQAALQVATHVAK